MADQDKSKKRLLHGQVVSDKGDKTIVVAVKRRVSHPLYGKRYFVTKKHYVHDEKNQAKVGDQVEIIEHQPISKTKRWQLVAVTEASVKEAGK